MEVLGRLVNGEGVEEDINVLEELSQTMMPYHNFIMGTGCDLPPETPLANIEAFMAAARGG